MCFRPRILHKPSPTQPAYSYLPLADLTQHHMLKVISLYWHIIHLGIKIGFLPGKNPEVNESNLPLSSIGMTLASYKTEIKVHLSHWLFSLNLLILLTYEMVIMP